MLAINSRPANAADMQFIEIGRHKPFQMFSEHFFFRITKNLFRAPVPFDDPRIAVDGDDGIVGGIDEGTVALVALAKFVFLAF